MIPKYMKAAVVHTFGNPLTLDSVPVPRPGAGQILVRVAASGVCHTTFKLRWLRRGVEPWGCLCGGCPILTNLSKGCNRQTHSLW